MPQKFLELWQQYVRKKLIRNGSQRSVYRGVTNVKLKFSLAWLQLSSSRISLFLAIVGIGFADILMFMQLGFQEALFDSNTRIHRNLLADLVVINSQSKALHSLKPFSRRRLYQGLSVPQVKSIAPIHIYGGEWKNPETGEKRILMVLASDPSQAVLNFPGINQQLNLLKQSNVVLFDTKSRPEFGSIAAEVNQGKTVKTELNGSQVKVGGLVDIGTSFAFDGSVLLGTETFMSVFPGRNKNQISLGLFRLKPGVEPKTIRRQLAALLPKDVMVLTRQEFVDLEKHYWRASTPIGFIFTVGTGMGFFVGIVIVYQILYTSISNHLPEYATLKAIGYPHSHLALVIIESALILSLLGYIPGFIISTGLYLLTQAATQLPIAMTLTRAIIILILTMLMCLCSGALTFRRLRDADPADIF